MGSQSVTAIKSKKGRKEFVQYLLKDIEAFEYMLQNNLFETGVQKIGAEQELCIVDECFRPNNIALDILDQINDEHYTTELALFNLEINLDPHKLEKKCFSDLEKELNILLNKGKALAKDIDNSKIILAGILPSLKKKDLIFKNVTPFKRYKTINNVIRKIRGDDFKLHIQGVDELNLKHESILFEACNTSFQVHLQINPEEAIDKYNWSQAIAGPLLSVMTNSPLLLGKELWSETRIALFQQSIDLRNTTHFSREQKARVSFGNGWLKNSILELFTDDIARYSPIVTSSFSEDSLALVKDGIMPKLKALSLHNGTLYKWNRLCYGVHNNSAHLRIENRYIPAGPSVKDEIANALLWVGVMQGMTNGHKEIWNKMSFHDAKSNFINAARTGLNSYFKWFNKGYSAKRLLEEVLIPIAKKGLQKSNVDENDINYYLGIIQQRINKNITGSSWIRSNKRILRKRLSKYETNVILTEHIYKNQDKNLPISQWKTIDVEFNNIDKKYDKAYKIMSSNLYVVHENDYLKLAKKIMEWKKIHHIPVVNNQNRVVGVINSDCINSLDFEEDKNQHLVSKDVMNLSYKIVNPETTFNSINNTISKSENSCVIVIDKEEMVGIITQNDINKVRKLKDL